MCTALSLSSTSTIFYYLNILEKQGKIRKTGLKSRALEIIDESIQDKGVPLVGTVAAGIPITAEENIEEYINLPKGYFSLDNDDLFILKVQGDSMINAGIFEGDNIVVKKQTNANNGEIVVALLDDSATVKRFYKDKDSIRLVAENPNYAPIISKEITVIGVVQGLMRRF
jgi:repressor LexA